MPEEIDKFSNQAKLQSFRI